MRIKTRVGHGNIRTIRVFCIEIARLQEFAKHAGLRFSKKGLRILYYPIIVFIKYRLKLLKT